MTEEIHVWNCYLPAAFHVVPRIADQSDLVENGLIDAEVGSDVAGLVAAMEHLALRFNVGVESGLGLGSAGESGNGNGVVHGKAGVPRSDQGVDFGGWQRGLKLIPINSWTKLATIPPLLPLFLLLVGLLRCYVLNVEILLRTKDNIRENVGLYDTFRRSQTNFPAILLLSQATAPMTRKKTIDCILADLALWELEDWSGGSECVRGKMKLFDRVKNESLASTFYIEIIPQKKLEKFCHKLRQIYDLFVIVSDASQPSKYPAWCQYLLLQSYICASVLCLLNFGGSIELVFSLHKDSLKKVQSSRITAS